MQVVGRCEKLQNVYQTAIIGSYGGGDAFRAARQLFVVGLPFPPESEDSQAKCSDMIAKIKRDSWEVAQSAYNREKDKDRDERIVNIPARLVDKEAIQYELKFQISANLKDVDHYNMLCQGWLFAEDVLEEGRQGVSRWPLIGLYYPENIRNNPMEPASVGINTLAFADQHVHLVEEILELDGFEIPLSDWHFGSDMAQFMIEHDSPFAQCWAVCLDLEKARCEISYLIIVNNEAVISLVEKHLKERNPLENKATLAEFATEIVDLLTKELAIPSSMAIQILELLGAPQGPQPSVPVPMEVEKEKVEPTEEWIVMDSTKEDSEHNKDPLTALEPKDRAETKAEGIEDAHKPQEIEKIVEEVGKEKEPDQPEVAQAKVEDKSQDIPTEEGKEKEVMSIPETQQEVTNETTNGEKEENGTNAHEEEKEKEAEEKEANKEKELKTDNTNNNDGQQEGASDGDVQENPAPIKRPKLGTLEL